LQRERRSLYLFRRDFRLGDHAGLAEASRFGHVVPALILDPSRERRLERNPRRAAYYCGAVSSLRDDLRARGAALVVRRGSMSATVLRLARESQAETVVWSAAYDGATMERDRALQAALEEAGLRVSLVHDAPAVPPDDTAAQRASDDGSGYRAFAPYVAAWQTVPRTSFDAPVRFADIALASDGLPEPGAFGATALAVDEMPSEFSTLAAFDAYLAGPALAYRSARNVPAQSATSRLSAALSFGIVSARTLLARIDARRGDRFLLSEERSSLDALERALVQRDFFLQLGWFFEETPDLALQSRMRAFPFARSHPGLAAWREGRTGYPLVDAGMRQLIATGWMHPRVRLVAASFLCFDLGVDWRIGRDAWDDLLIEDDAALATGNWQWSAGVGADLAQFPRIFNPRKQARWFDPLGTYVRRYVPELANVPATAVLNPEATAHRRQIALPLFDANAYPQPIVDHEPAARSFLARYTAFVGSRRTGEP
jgi:deoxyribodipyrimidine photo-lyase